MDKSGAAAATCVLILAVSVQAALVDVKSIAELQAAIGAAKPGDQIIMANGVYSSGGKITVNRAGTAAQPILIAAQTVGGAEITGAGGFALNSPAAYVTLRGFKFTHAAGAVTIAVGATHCRFTRNVFQLTGSTYVPYLVISGDDAQIDYNTFQHKNFVGQMISIQGPGSDQMAQRTWIHHNYFYDFPNCGENNCSAIQIGLSSRSLTPAHALVEYNLFSQTRGENENICNKSCDNTYRYNTFRDRSTELSLRHGDRQQVYGNFFINTDGLRFCGNDHKIYSNFFTQCTPAINVANGDGNVPPDDLKSHDRPDSVKVVFNTLVNNGSNVIMTARSGGLGATRLTLANNIIQGGPAAASFDGPMANPVYQGNIIWGNGGGAGDLPAGGYTSVNPNLAADANGVFRLQAGSPAIGKAAGTYAYVALDLDGQARLAPLDVGADQFSGGGPAFNRPLTVADVGPDAAGPIAIVPGAAAGKAVSQIFKSHGDMFVFPERYRGSEKSVSVFGMTGNLLWNSIVGKEAGRLDLKNRDGGGIYFIRVQPLP